MIIKIPILVSVALLLLFVGGVLLINTPRGNRVEFIISDNISEVSIFDANSNSESIKTLEKSSIISLDAGDYTVTSFGEKTGFYTKIISVQNDSVIEIDPPYSANHLDDLLDDELSALSSTIEQFFGENLDDLSVSRGELLERGDWYSTTIFERINDPRQQPDYYVLLLSKSADSWEVVAGPDIVLTRYDYPDIPIDILTLANNTVSEFFVEE